jgi:hypothetical protein
LGNGVHIARREGYSIRGAHGYGGHCHRLYGVNDGSQELKAASSRSVIYR